MLVFSSLSQAVGSLKMKPEKQTVSTLAQRTDQRIRLHLSHSTDILLIKVGVARSMCHPLGILPSPKLDFKFLIFMTCMDKCNLKTYI